MSNVVPVVPEDDLIRTNTEAIRAAGRINKTVIMRNEQGRATFSFNPGTLFSVIAERLRQRPNETAWLDDGKPLPNFNPVGEKGSAYLEGWKAAEAAKAKAAAEAAQQPPPDDKPTPPSPSGPASLPSADDEPEDDSDAAELETDDGRHGASFVQADEPSPAAKLKAKLKRAPKVEPEGDGAESDAQPRGDDKGRHEEGNTESTKPGVILICAADVEPEPIEWLWPGRFALGKIGMIAGQASLGKSQVTIDMAARITTGREWPNAEGEAPTGNVIFLTAEDDPNDILVPRLMAAGADRERVFFVSMVKDPPELGSRQRQFNVTKDVGKLCEAIDAIGSNVRLVVIDPITAYLGSGKDVDSHKATDVRDALNPLLHYTEKLRFATILISHLNKSGSTEAMTRVLGSGAFVHLARTVYLVAADTEKERALFLQMKNNIGKKAAGLAYVPVTKFVSSTKHANIETSCLAWDEDEVDKTADEALSDLQGRVIVGGGDSDPTAVHEAEQFLGQLLMEGPLPVKEIFRQAKDAGISQTTLKRAKKKLGIMSGHSGSGGQNGAGEWTWENWKKVHLPLSSSQQ